MSTQTDYPQTETNDDLKQLLREAEEAIAQATGDVSEKFSDLRERMHAALSSDTGIPPLERIRAEAYRRARQADQMVRENPYYAIGIAAAVGAIIGIFVSRQCSN